MAQQGYPGQQGYGQQPGYGLPQGGAPVAPPAKKKSRAGIIIAILVLLPLLGLGGWLGYQHYENWGYMTAPDNVKAKVDPTIEDMREMAEKVAKLCNDGDLKTNPLEDSKILKIKGLTAARAECQDAGFGGTSAPQYFPPLTGVKEYGELDIRNTDNFKCMPPNFMGFDDDTKTDCVMWKGSKTHYYVERVSGKKKGRVAIEME